MTRNRNPVIASKLKVNLLIALMVSLMPSFARSEVIHYAYDNMYRLVQVEYENGTVVDRTYDALGNQQTKTISSSTPLNNVPNVPGNPEPADASTQISTNNANISWTGGDPDQDDAVMYDIYFGPTFPPPLYKSGLKATSLVAPPLHSVVTYYWQIVSKDNYNQIAEGPVWSFTTGNDAPTAPDKPVPTVGDIVSYENVYLSWASAEDPNLDDTVTYDVYLGETITPSLIQSDLSDLTPIFA